ncbi:MAG: DUF6702 family protein [Gammaproteobacteria bacterium]
MMRARLSALVLALLLAAPTWAHQQKESITRVLFNPRTGNIEVMHRFLLHDLEHASDKLFGKTVDLLRSASDRDQFEGYVHEHFALADQNGAAVPLTPVGNEIEGRFLWVYAEAAIPEQLSALTITHDALHNVWPEQTNLVNVERANDVRSALFQDGSGEITVGF